MTSSKHRTLRRVAASVAAALIGLATLVVGSPAHATVVPGTHRCQNFGQIVSGYKAGECSDIDRFVGSTGLVGFRGLGQGFCQRASDGVAVQCAGVSMTIIMENLAT